MAIVPVARTDSFDTVRQKINQGLNDINNALIQQLIQLDNPVNNGDTLVYSTSDNKFHNTLLDVLIQNYLTANSITPVSKGKQYFLGNLNNIV